ncbi:MAG: hypothetical protein ACK5WB_12105 [Phycisphaerales bacterium]|jgi:hypothetical protein|nr:hypothetical protein [Phycisphaeraceae bacterium]
MARTDAFGSVVRGIARRGLCSLLLPAGALGMMAALAEATFAQADIRPPTPITKPALATVPPTPADTMRAYRSIRTWVDGWGLPPRPAAGDLPIASGANVALRLEGQVIAQGTRMALTTAGETADRAIWEAVVRTFEQADRRLPVERDVLRGERLRELGPSIALSLELAGAVVTIEPKTLDDLDAMLAPGIDGLAVRVAGTPDQSASGELEAMFPGAMLAANLAPSEAMRPLVSKATGQPTLALLSPGELRERHNVTFYRFRTTHLAQPTVGVEPMFLDRGARLIGLDRVDSRADLVAFAADLAGNLIRRRYPGVEPLGLFGTHLPWTGKFDPAIASIPEQMLAYRALTMFAQTPGVDPDRAREAMTLAEVLLRAAATPTDERAMAWENPVDAAAVLLAMGDPAKAPTPEVRRLIERCTETVLSAMSSRGGEAIPQPARAFVALAATRIPVQADRARALVRDLFKGTQDDALVTHMPWLGWAELDLAGSGADVPAAISLRRMRDLVYVHQIRPDDAGADGPDLVGGIVFTKSRNPLPTWQAARPIAFIATMLGDPRLTAPDERSRELVRLLTSLRFLRQLQADDSTAWMQALPGSARGGIRSAPWDQRMPVDATAITLMAITESIRSLDALSPAKSGGIAAPAAPRAPQ